MSQPRLAQTLSSYLPPAAQALLAFTLIPLILSYAGEEEYGIWALMGVVIALMTVLDFGMAVATVKYTAISEASSQSHQRNGYLSSILFAYAVIAFATLPLLGLFCWLIPFFFSLTPEQALLAQKVLLTLGLTTLCIQLPFSLFRGILLGSKQITLVNGTKALSLIFYLLIGWLLLHWNWGILGVALAAAFAIACEHALYVTFCFHFVPTLHLSPTLIQKEKLQEVLSYSGYQFVVNLMSVLYLQMDVLIIGAFLTLNEVGLYAIALKIASQGLMLVKMPTNTLTPFFATLHAQGDLKGMRALFLKGVKLTFLVACMGGLLAWTLAPQAIQLWLGPGYDEAVSLLWILLAVIPIQYPMLVAASLLHMSGEHRYATGVAIGSTCLNAFLSWILVQWIGMWGVAWSTVAVIWLWEGPLFLKQTLKVLGWMPTTLTQSDQRPI